MRLWAIPLGLLLTTGAVVAVAGGWRAAPRAGTAEAVPGGMIGTAGTVMLERGDTPASPALPWLHNFAATAESGVAMPGTVARMSRWRPADMDCGGGAYGGLSIVADVAEPRGTEEVLASYTQGVLVVDAAGRLIASATAPVCRGSADAIEAIAAGDAQIGRPVIAMAMTTGGHRESSTWLVLYQVIGGVVAPVFSAMVEERRDDHSRSGSVTLLPGALMYRAPSGGQTLWTYSDEQQRYIELAMVTPPTA
jgi:hypothetical protein